jgi:Asp-tRNA(Asn)/Glu-tRNA(Gln) amidotransferase A subunit family amidase
MMPKPCDLSACEARFLIGSKQLSPVDLLESCLERIGEVNHAVNGVVAIDERGARRAAADAEAAVMRGDALKPLHGLPVGVKDLNDTAGLRTTYGSLAYAQHVPEKDEHLVANLRTQGAIVFAKTNTPEWGAGGNTFNPVYGVSGNPFAPHLTCGGSSGGSAIALSLGMMPLAHGSDNAGSLRIPAAFCGVVGMRPTAGIVASDKRSPGLSHLPVQGPMARSAEDAMMLFQAMATSASIDPLATPLPGAATAAPADLSRLRVAISDDLGFAPIEKALRDTFERKVEAFRSCFNATDHAAPEMGEARLVYEILRAVNYVGMYARKGQDEGRGARLVAQNLEHASRFTLEDAGWATVEQARIYRRVQVFFEQFDLLITPTVGVHPWPKHEIYPATVDGRAMENYFDWVALTYGVTLINHPSISIPCGFDDRGTPFGIQLVGRRNSDLQLFGIAIALERLLQRHAETKRPIPDMARLRAWSDDDQSLPVT